MVLLLSLLAVMSVRPGNAIGAVYYVDSVGGDDAGAGTSASAAWKTLAKVSATSFHAGDRILLRRDRQFTGTLILRSSGTSTAPIAIDAYGQGNKPVVIGDATTDGVGAIRLEDVSFCTIRNLEVQAPCTSGMILQGCSHVTVKDCDFTNIEYLPPRMPEGQDAWSIAVRPGKVDGAHNTIDRCAFRKCAKGVIIFAGDNIVLRDSYFYDVSDIPALFAGHCVGRTVTNSRITGCVFDYTNTTAKGWNTVMFGGTDNCYQEYCETKNTPAGEWDHQVYDFDTNCRNSYIQYNYSHDNHGDLMHSYWVGDASANGPCYFRYNISVNDRTIYNGVKTTYGLQMHNNIFYNFGGNFGRDIVASDLSDTVVRNNIFHMRPGAGGVESLPPGSDANCYANRAKPEGEANSIEGDPGFIDPSKPPMGLRLAADSPCRDWGFDGIFDYWRSCNLALHCAVTSGSSHEDQDWSVSKLVDGTINTEPWTGGWRSSGNDSADHAEWVTLDLGAEHDVNRVVLYPRNDYGYVGAGFPKSFAIRTSTDNLNWTTAAVRTDRPRPGRAPQHFSFRTRKARYVRIDMTSLRPGSDGKYVAALAEVEVLDDGSPVPRVCPPAGNLALNKDVIASSSAEKDGWYKVKLTDGMRSSMPEAMGWSTDPSVTTARSEWVKIDLEAVCSVGRVDLYPRNDSGNVGLGFPIDFTIDVSADDLIWTTVSRQAGYPLPADGSVRSLSFAPVKARFVRVSATGLRRDGSGSHGMALAEIEVYN